MLRLMFLHEPLAYALGGAATEWFSRIFRINGFHQTPLSLDASQTLLISVTAFLLFPQATSRMAAYSGFLTYLHNITMKIICQLAFFT